MNNAQGTQDKIPGKRRAKIQPDVTNRKETITLESSDEDHDQELLKNFLIVAHLPLSNKPYGLTKLKKKSILSEKSNDLENLTTRKAKRPLTDQEKQQFERVPLIFLRDQFKGPAHTVNPKTGLRLEQVARKTGTIARIIQNPRVIWGAIQNDRKRINTKLLPTYCVDNRAWQAAACNKARWPLLHTGPKGI